MNIPEARAASKFAKVAKQATGTVRYKVQVPGHSGRNYEVLLRRVRGGYSGECLQQIGMMGVKPCISTERHSNGVCYHIGAALVAVARENGFNLAFCNSQADAKRLANISGGIVLVYTRHNSDSIRYAVTTKANNHRA